MSVYGHIRDEILIVRQKLARSLGVETADLSRLSVTIRTAAAHTQHVDALLALWAELEERAAQLDPETGNPR